MSDQGTCEWCGGPIPPRLDPRGRKPRFCSDAHRAAATRDRKKREHAAELDQARTQTSIDLRDPEDFYLDAAETLRVASIGLGNKDHVPDYLRELVTAARDFLQEADKIESSKPLESERVQPRRKRRRAVRKSGQ